ncbi:hypothetical protein [Cupriavidus sp. D39]|uniref:hypothetical protein n=1 Tax=Cupriavidus sp. D39 TaxID=2997877 RepID=UPI00226F685D|nr:hypothetical protein [Cupriavidus sp. D39]MCY0852536.1 hypothetical protein [Cupriavidus sp. D39]
MKSHGGFKKPTIKDNGRAYVRLFGYFATQDEWLRFLTRYVVKHVPFGMERNGDCAVRVIDPTTGELATLGLELPNEIKHHTYVATARSFWNENFANDTQRRSRTVEVGFDQPSKDEVVPR